MEPRIEIDEADDTCGCPKFCDEFSSEEDCFSKKMRYLGNAPV